MRRLGPVTILAVASVLAASATVTAASPWHLLASGLHNPRGVSLGPYGRLYVALAGVGAGTEHPGMGPTGEIISIRHPGTNHATVLSVRPGLLSFGSTRAGETVGPDGISVGALGTIWTIMAGSSKLAGVNHPQIGRLLRIRPDGSWTAVANVGDRGYRFTKRHPELDPGGQFPDANPYGVLVTHGKVYVVDAGANTLDRVRPDGRVEVLAYFPNTQAADAVPTCIDEGPDGALYIGTLALVDSLFAGPSHPAATVYRVDPARTRPGDYDRIIHVAKPWAKGFWPIHGCAFGPDGSLWVSEIYTTATAAGPAGGGLVRVPFDHPTDAAMRQSYGHGVLRSPGGIAVAADGTVYISNKSDTRNGEVLRLRP